MSIPVKIYQSIPWATPTPWPTADPASLEIDTGVIADSGREAIVNMAESGVSTWQVANSQGALDTIITLMLIIAVVISIYSIVQHVRSIE